MKIFPIKEICSCGKKVLNHHFLCDKCWSKKYSNCQRIKSRIKQYEFLLKNTKNKKPIEDKIEKLNLKLKELK